MVDLAQLRAWNRSLQIGELHPEVPNEQRLYVPLADPGWGAIDEVRAALRLSYADSSVHLLSGPRGSGKSTELLRLKSSLEVDGFRVVRFDVLAYVSETQPVDIETFLVMMGLAVSEAVLGQEAGSLSFGDKLRRWLSGWRPKSVDVKAEVGLPLVGSATIGAEFERLEDLRRDLRSNPSFVAWLRDQLGFFVGQLKSEVDAHIAKLSQDHGNGLPLVVIVDSLEKLGGNTLSSEEVRAATANLFLDHPGKLKFPGTHVIYTVPPYVPVLFPGLATDLAEGVLHQVAVPRVEVTAVNSGARHGVPIGLFVEAVDRRLPDRTELLSDSEVRRVVLASGGHLQDLFNLLGQVINLVVAHDAPLPASPELVEAAVADIRATFTPRTSEDTDAIRWVHLHGDGSEPKAELVPRLARLLATHLVLLRRNDHDWYEVHPLTAEALGSRIDG